MNGLQRIVFLCLAVIGGTLAGCGGGGVSTTPLPQTGSTATPPAASVYAIPIASETTVPVAGAGTPVPLPQMSTDFASLASVLVAAQPVAPASAGVLGTITAISGRTITVQQTTPLAATDSTGATPDFEQTYESVGTAGGTVTVALIQNATIATPGGLANLVAGQQIIAGGTASGTTLTADFVLVVGDAPAATNAVARSAAAASRAPQDVATPPGWVSDNGTLSASGGVPGGIHLPGNQLIATTQPYSCSIGGTQTGQATLNVASDMAIALPQVTVAFPYRIDYDPTPAPYMNTGAGYQSPGAMNTWMQFVPLPGSSSAPSYDVAFRFDASINFVVKESCTNSTVVVYGVTAGYGYESATTAAYPSASQKVSLTPVKCIDVNIPIHFTFPASGKAGLNPFGSSQAGLDVCGIPQITGGVLSATPADVMQGSFSGGQVVFDPSQSGPASVSTAPLLNPTGANASFTLNPTAPVTYIDGETVQYTLYNVCVIGIPTCSQSGGGVPLLPTFTRQLTSTPQTINLSAPQYATCVITDAIQEDNDAPPSTNCNTSMYIANGDEPATITISNLPQGTYSFNAAGKGAIQQYGPTCDGANFAPYYTVTPASASGTSVTFQFSATGATQNAQLQCAGTFVNQNGQAVQFAQGQTIGANLLVNEFPANPLSKARRSK